MQSEAPEIEKLLHEIIELTGESRIEAIHKALDERRQRLALQTVAPRSEARLLAFLDDEIWPQVSPELLGKLIPKEEEDAILGFGDLGL